MNPFHAHVDRCSQCACNPFDLCPTGADLHAQIAAECRAQILIVEVPRPYKGAAFVAPIARTEKSDRQLS